jgi:hypothetical protein
MENIQIEILYPKYFKIVDIYGALKVIPTAEKLIILCSNLSQKNQFILVKFQSKKKNKKGLLTVNLNFTENGEKKNIVKHIKCINNNVLPEKILLANKIISAINCVRNKLINQQYKLDCLDKFVNEPNVPDNIVLLRNLINARIR